MVLVKVETAPYVFNMYMYNLSISLNRCNIGCYNKTKVNHLVYVVDLVLILPFKKGFHKLMKSCCEYGAREDSIYIGDISSVMYCAQTKDKHISPSTFSIQGRITQTNIFTKHLGHITIVCKRKYLM